MSSIQGLSTNNESIVIDYFELSQKYKQIYGEKTVVLLQVGSFFEIYALKNPDNSNYEIIPIQIVSQITNLNVAEKKMFLGNSTETITVFPKFPTNATSKSIKSWLNQIQKCQVVMSGFQYYQLDKYIQKLSENGFTSVVYSQHKDGKEVTRKLDRVFSPGTFISDEINSSNLSNNIMCIWFDTYKSNNVDFIVCGVSSINIFTGESTLFEYTTQYYINPTSFDEIERYISTLNPCEIIVLSDFEDDTMTINKIIQYIGIPYQTTIHNIHISKCLNQDTKQKIENCTKQVYIQEMLSIFYSRDVFNLCTEFQNSIVATQSFCYLLNFIQEHNPDLVRKIHLPIFSNTSDRMVLANHTLRQLNIINDGNSTGHLSSVSSFINKCSTPMGKRQMQYQITNPTFNQEWLNQEYTNIENVLSCFPDYIGYIRTQLQQVRDIEKMLRQILTHKLIPSSIYHMYNSCKTIQELYLAYPTILDNTKNVSFTNSLKSFLGFLEQHFVLEVCSNTHSLTTFDHNIICMGISKELDDNVNRQKVLNDTIFQLQTALTQLLIHENSKYVDCIKIHETEKSGKSFQITKTRGKLLRKILDDMIQNSKVIVYEQFCLSTEDVKITSVSGSNDEIEFPLLNKITKELFKLQDDFNSLITKTYQEILKKIEVSWFDKIESFSNYISKLDVLINKSYIAKTYNYCRPLIQEAETSFFKAEGIRHALIEHINTNEIYVSNDVELGSSGILLYGTNSVGKTSLIRSIGICLILSQSGMYVPCSSFIYKPYKFLFSRILGNDNLFKNLSTFVFEMSELRTILNYCDENSLILGDELCSGTENESAQSIFVSGLSHIHKKKSSFIFATHINEVCCWEEIKELNRLSIKHMSVSFDREIGKLLYDRKLKEGVGLKSYGLIVCKSLYMPTEFLENAFNLRNKYFPENLGTLSHKTSTYNTQKIRGKCEICNEIVGEEIHHINQQKDADENGFIGHFHKNHKANLKSVCEKCHDKIHHIEKEEPKVKVIKKIIRKKLVVVK